MAKVTADSLAIDCPDPKALAAFYAKLLGVETKGDDALVTPEGLELWFQPVEGYQAPTWPTQERGQQIHLDFATDEIEAAVAFAESTGARRAPDQGEHGWIVMLDPAGHPFCFVQHHDEVDGDPRLVGEEGPSIKLRGPFVDCPDHRALAEFYLELLGGRIILEPDDEYVVIETATDRPIAFQRVEGYQPPTWPTQERGQQMHFDFTVDDMDAAQAHAIELGAKLVDDGQESFHVFLDPVGHPFCLCIPEA